jgi:hypothetical protein
MEEHIIYDEGMIVDSKALLTEAGREPVSLPRASACTTNAVP